MTIETKVILTLLSACIGIPIPAQEAQTEEPKGKAIIQVFGDFHTGFGSENDERGFELERSYLGYEYRLGGGLSIKGVMDIGKSSDVSDYHRIAYIKNAMVSWKKGNMILNGGLIPTTQFNLLEKSWNYRYIMKSFQDQYGYSAFASIRLSEHADIYARFDDLFSIHGWNKAKDEQNAILGAQFKLGKYVKITPNFRINMPKADESQNGYSVYINYYWGF